MIGPNKARLRLWVEALESGEFRQGRLKNVIQTPDGPHYCCLGVANEIAWRNGCPRPDGIYDGVDLHYVVAAWYGLGNHNPIIGRTGGFEDYWSAVSAVTANDVERWSFDRIAAAVRQRFDLGEWTVSID